MSFIHDYSISYCYNMTLELKEDLSGDYFVSFVADDARGLGFTPQDLQAWTPPVTAARRSRQHPGA
jgi:hypothetical protein